MSNALWDEVFVLCEASKQEVYVERSNQRVKETAEVFTPTDLVIRILRDLPPESYAPGKSVLDPACGDGQFLVCVKFAKMLIWGSAEALALSEIYGVDIIPENVRLAKKRLGGGTVLVGNTLQPLVRIQGQTDNDYASMQELFGQNLLTLF